MNSLAEEIEILIDSKISNIPFTLYCKIIKVYSDNYVDVETDLGGFSYIKNIGENASVGDDGLIIFIDGNSNKPVCIGGKVNLSNYYTKKQIDDIISGGADLGDYVKKVDLIDKTKYDIDINLVLGESGVSDCIQLDFDITNYTVDKTINIGD